MSWKKTKVRRRERRWDASPNGGPCPERGAEDLRRPATLLQAQHREPGFAMTGFRSSDVGAGWPALKSLPGPYSSSGPDPISVVYRELAELEGRRTLSAADRARLRAVRKELRRLQAVEAEFGMSAFQRELRMKSGESYLALERARATNEAIQVLLQNR